MTSSPAAQHLHLVNQPQLRSLQARITHTRLQDDSARLSPSPRRRSGPAALSTEQLTRHQFLPHRPGSQTRVARGGAVTLTSTLRTLRPSLSGPDPYYCLPPQMDNQAPAPLLPRHCRRGGRQPPSCTQCQQRKIKCDRKLPCNRCTRGRRAGACVYTTAGVSATAASSTTNRLGRNRDAAEAGQSQVARVADPAAVSGPESCGAASYGQAEEAAGVDVVLLAKRVEELENRLGELSAAHRAEPAADVVTEQCLFRKGRVFGRSHLMHTLDQASVFLSSLSLHI